MSDTDRPVHHEVDCSTGQATLTPVTDEELEQIQARTTAAFAEQAEAAAEEAALRAAVAAHPDPLVKALAARLGLA